MTGMTLTDEPIPLDTPALYNLKWTGEQNSKTKDIKIPNVITNTHTD